MTDEDDTTKLMNELRKMSAEMGYLVEPERMSEADRIRFIEKRFNKIDEAIRDLNRRLLNIDQYVFNQRDAQWRLERLLLDVSETLRQIKARLGEVES